MINIEKTYFDDINIEKTYFDDINIEKNVRTYGVKFILIFVV